MILNLFLILLLQKIGFIVISIVILSILNIRITFKGFLNEKDILDILHNKLNLKYHISNDNYGIDIWKEFGYPIERALPKNAEYYIAEGVKRSI